MSSLPSVRGHSQSSCQSCQKYAVKCDAGYISLEGEKLDEAMAQIYWGVRRQPVKNCAREANTFMQSVFKNILVDCNKSLTPVKDNKEGVI